MYKSIPNFHLKIFNKYILILIPLWWELLALLSFIPISDLELGSTFRSNIHTLFLIPFILFFFPFLTIKLFNIDKIITTYEKINFSFIYIFFYLFALISLFQFYFYGIPALDPNPDVARIDWEKSGNLILKALAEITFRISFILTAGKIILKKKLNIINISTIIYSFLYCYLMSTRSLFMEYFFYIIMAYFIQSETIDFLKEKSVIFYKKIFKLLKRNFLYLFFGSNAIFIFILLGQIRMRGEDFNAFEYAQIDINIPLILQPTISWLWLYLIANMHNLRLIIDESFTNDAFSNVFGGLLSAFKIVDYVEGNSYIYIGKTNLGTALRTWIMDFGPERGIIFFGLAWSLIILIYLNTKNIHIRSSLSITIIYYGFIIPITSRIEEVVYLAPILFLFFLDKVRNIKLFFKH
tara:strand:+ start:52765 stop:53991 length:1227 start_codon:yes stop_codon:yes gene_type:complete